MRQLTLVLLAVFGLATLAMGFSPPVQTTQSATMMTLTSANISPPSDLNAVNLAASFAFAPATTSPPAGTNSDVVDCFLTAGQGAVRSTLFAGGQSVFPAIANSFDLIFVVPTSPPVEFEGNALVAMACCETETMNRAEVGHSVVSNGVVVALIKEEPKNGIACCRC